MPGLVLLDGDDVLFLPSFAPAVVTVRPGKLKASSPKMIEGRNMCLDGDEKNVSVPGCVYITPQYSIPGTGTLKVVALGPDHRAALTKVLGKAALLKGGNFTAVFEVLSPAQQPPRGPGSPIPDPTRSYTGAGMFGTTNNWLHVT